MSQKDAGPSTELVAIVMFFAGFVLGVEAERTQVPTTGAPAAAVAQAPPSAAQHYAVRGTTSLLQLGGSVIP